MAVRSEHLRKARTVANNASRLFREESKPEDCYDVISELRTCAFCDCVAALHHKANLSKDMSDHLHSDIKRHIGFLDDLDSRMYGQAGFSVVQAYCTGLDTSWELVHGWFTNGELDLHSEVIELAILAIHNFHVIMGWCSAVVNEPHNPAAMPAWVATEP